MTFAPVRFADLPGWKEDQPSAALPALRRSCAKHAGESAAAAALPAHDIRPACAALAAAGELGDAAARGFLERWFQPYRAGADGNAEGLFTGYYEPELSGARHAGGRFNVPLYGVPKDLVTVDLGAFDDSLKGKHVTGRVRGTALQPYPTRAEIEAGALRGTAPEVLWVGDQIDAFFLQIQGSGRVILDDGSVVRVGYAGQNGRRYRSIGKILVERGVLSLEDVTLQSLKAWLRAHPAEARALMDENAAYVFFHELKGDGPVGAEGVVLTPERSLAVDPAYVPLGLPLWLDIESPEAGQRIRRLVVAQDTGSAIKGAVRGDLFWGHGARAEAMAGRMRAKGGYFLLLPRATPGEAALPGAEASRRG